VIATVSAVPLMRAESGSSGGSVSRSGSRSSSGSDSGGGVVLIVNECFDAVYWLKEWRNPLQQSQRLCLGDMT